MVLLTSFKQRLKAAKISIILLGVAASVMLLQFHVAVGLTSDKIRKIAKEITVQIDGGEPGSGVIVNQEGHLYTVLTNCHVVDTPGTYIIGTHDNEKYTIQVSQPDCSSEADLAILQFSSSKDYPVAELGNSSELIESTIIYVSGWAGRGRYSGERRYRFDNGNIIGLDEEARQGYEIVHKATTLPGMSGGPILDEKGRLMGISGQAEPDPNLPLVEFYAIPINIYISWQSIALTPEQTVPVDRDIGKPNLSAIEIEDIARNITILIQASNPLGFSNRGSGVIINCRDNRYYIATNYHIVEQPDQYTVVQIRADFLSPVVSETFDVEKIKKSRDPDLALITVRTQEVCVVPSLGSSRRLREGQDNVFVSGFPGDNTPRWKFIPAQVTDEEVRRVPFHWYESLTYRPSSQLSIEERNSSRKEGSFEKGMGGGPVLNQRGELVGIHQGIITEERPNDGVAIPIETILKTFPEIVQ